MTEYVVIGPEPLVAQDLADAIGGNDPTAVVRVYRTAQEGMASLATARACAVIIHCDPEDFVGSALCQRLIAEGVPHAVLSASGEATSAGPPVLASPFNEATVKALLDEILAGRQSPGD